MEQGNKRMKRLAFPSVILGLFLFGSTGSIVASDADELRDRAKAMRAKAALLMEQGNKDLARRIEMESEELLEIAERLQAKPNAKLAKDIGPSVDKEVFQLKDRLQDLLHKERSIRENRGNESDLHRVREEIAEIERSLQKIHRQHPDKAENRPEFRAEIAKLEKAGQRMHHLRVAAEHLKLAEEHDLAHKMMEQAESIERDVHAAKRRLAAEMHSETEQNKDRPDVIAQLKEENERLKNSLRELKQRFDKSR
jgi:DNA repair exonuclease SbcCD ATPase subunit